MKSFLTYLSAALLIQCLALIPVYVLGQNDNVGINTEDPEETLHVNGTIRSDSLGSPYTRIVFADSNGTLILGELGNEPILYDPEGNEVFNFNANTGFVIINPPPPPGGGGGPHGPVGVVGHKVDTIYVGVKINVDEEEVEIDAETAELPKNVMLKPPGKLESEDPDGGRRCGLDLDPDDDRVRVRTSEDTLDIHGADSEEPRGMGLSCTGHLSVSGHDRLRLDSEDDMGHTAGVLCDPESGSTTVFADSDSLRVTGLTPQGEQGTGLTSDGRLELSGHDILSGLTTGLSLRPDDSLVVLTGGSLELEDGTARFGNVEIDSGGLHYNGLTTTGTLVPSEGGSVTLSASDSDIDWEMTHDGIGTVTNHSNGFSWVDVMDSDALAGQRTSTFSDGLSLVNTLNWNMGQSDAIVLTTSDFSGTGHTLRFSFDSDSVEADDPWSFGNGLSSFGNVEVEGGISVTGGISNPVGPLVVVGDLDVVGNVTKMSGNFVIDHPLDPYHKDLVHSFVESPDMMNVYNGNVVTDQSGYSIVELPGYFEALNRDYRYQLTVIGEFAQAIVANEVLDNQFVIRTDRPNVKVSWQVTGIRNDVYARENPVEVERRKPDGMEGNLRYQPAEVQHP